MKTSAGKNLWFILSLLIAFVALPISAFAFSGVSPIQTMGGSAEFSVFYISGWDIDIEVGFEDPDMSSDTGVEREKLFEYKRAVMALALMLPLNRVA